MKTEDLMLAFVVMMAATLAVLIGIGLFQDHGLAGLLIYGVSLAGIALGTVVTARLIDRIRSRDN